MDIHLYKQENSKFWWMRYTENGRLIRKSTKCVKKSDAKDVVKLEIEKWRQRIGIGIQEEITLADLLDEVRKDYEINDRKSADRIKFSRKHLVKILGEDRLIEEITEQVIEDYKHQRKREKAANGTINRELALLRRGFKILRYQKKITDHPSIVLLQENNIRQGFIEVWEYREILKHFPEHLRPLITFLYKTGWRKSEAMNLTWQMVDLGRKYVRLPPGYTKNKKPRIFPFDEEMEQIFKRLWNEKELEKGDHNYVFLNKMRTGRILDFRGSWESACEDAGVGKRLIHDMRRSAVRNMVESGVTEKVAMELSGHLTRTVFENYHIVSTEDLAKAVKKTSENLKKMEKPKEGPKEGIIPDVPFRSSEYGGDYIELSKGGMVFPDEIIHYRKPTEDDFKWHVEQGIEKRGIDEWEEYVKEHEGDKKRQDYVRWTIEVLEKYKKKAATS
jgi:integrase